MSNRFILDEAEEDDDCVFQSDDSFGTEDNYEIDSFVVADEIEELVECDRSLSESDSSIQTNSFDSEMSASDNVRKKRQMIYKRLCIKKRNKSRIDSVSNLRNVDFSQKSGSGRIYDDSSLEAEIENINKKMNKEVDKKMEEEDKYNKLDELLEDPNVLKHLREKGFENKYERSSEDVPAVGVAALVSPQKDERKRSSVLYEEVGETKTSKKK